MFDKDRCRKILGDAGEFLTRNNIEYFPFFGTLLGFYRDGTFLSEDIDIVINAKDFTKFMVAFHEQDEFQLNAVWRREVALWKYERKIDVLFYDIVGENTYFYIYKRNKSTGRWHTEQRYNFKTADIFPLKRTSSYDFWQPQNPENVFKAYYGETWATPDPNWNRDRNPAPNLDADYRHIAVDLTYVANKEGWRDHFEQYDQDWIRIYNDGSKMVEPVILRPRNELEIPNKIEINVLLEILAMFPCVHCVTLDPDAKTDNTSYITRSSKGFSYGTATKFVDLVAINNSVPYVGSGVNILSAKKSEVIK